MRNVAAYANLRLHHYMNSVRLTVTMFYSCKAAGRFTLTESQMWDTFKDDPDATGQMWYCNVAQQNA